MNEEALLIAKDILEKPQALAMLTPAAVLKIAHALVHSTRPEAGEISSTPGTKWVQLGWAELGTVHGQRHIRRLRDLYEGRDNRADTPVYYLETYLPHEPQSSGS